MNTKSNLVRLLLATAALGAFAALAYAGPGSQEWVAAKPITTFAEAKAVGPDDVVTLQCKNCKTVMVRDSKYLGRGRSEWFAVGSKHTCAECKGEITVVKGKTTDSMQHNCSMCGEGTVSCCVAKPVKS